jgi:photosystem II stability/assembly factor-like uncharacterized protein
MIALAVRVVILIALVAGVASVASPAFAEPVSGLKSHTHIHGLAVDRSDPAYLFIATHHGLYRASPDGEAELVSVVQDFMGFSPHPSDANALYASGHPAGGGNLGLIASNDGGRTWTQVSPGANGPVDFHQMTVSHADPSTIYGAYGDLQMSRDGGNTWTIVAPAPERLIDLAGSSKDAEIVYAATEGGLLLSLDAGKTWKPLIDTAPVTMVEVTADGTMYAFLFGQGLATAKEGVFNWSVVSGDWDQDYILHLAVDPEDPDRMFAATGNGQIVASSDRGKTWAPFGQ